MSLHKTTSTYLSKRNIALSVVTLGVGLGYYHFGSDSSSSADTHSPAIVDQEAAKRSETPKVLSPVVNTEKQATPTAPAHTHSADCGCAADSKVNLVTAKGKAPAIKLTKELREGLLNYTKGQKISFTLPGGSLASGVVEVTQQNAGRTIALSGSLSAPQEGKFYFNEETMPGFAGAFSGAVYFANSDTAYKVKTNSDGVIELLETHVDQVVCRNYAAKPIKQQIEANDDPQEIPADHPTDIPIPAYQNGVIVLSSIPNATAVAYLDFDGEKGPHINWGDFDAAHSGANNTQIKRVWEGVAEDFAPFNINVTTDLQKYLDAPANSRIRCIITPTSTAAPGAGGVAFLGSFNSTVDSPCWSFSSIGKDAVEVISHEIGHALQLTHDGRTSPVEGYYSGHGSGDVGWAPIMGLGYYKNLSQWSKGEYLNANETQDDLAVIANNNNNVGYRPDDHATSLASATHLEISTDNSVNNEGVIGVNSDIDSFKFTLTGSNNAVSLNINTVTNDSNLDIYAELSSADGSTHITNNPDTGTDASFSTRLDAGEYILSITGTGRGSATGDGYTKYGCLGAYTVTGSVVNSVLPDRFSLAENPTVGATVGTVTANNNHGGASLTYAITSGNTSGAFAIDSNGVLTVADATKFDYEALSSSFEDPATFDLAVSITNPNSALNESVRVVVTLTNVNEPHTIAGASAIQTYKNASVGSLVSSFSTQDVDLYSNTMTWSITSGNTGNAFAIDTNGNITVANSSALASQSNYSLQISAVDNGSPVMSASKAVTVATLDWNPTNAVVYKNWTQEAGVSASQSSTSAGGNASRAIDGNTDGNWGNDSVTHTDSATTNSWWEVDLGADRSISAIDIYNRTDCCGSRLSNFRVSILNASRSEVVGTDYYTGSGNVDQSELWTLNSAVTGRYVRVQLNGTNNDGNGVLSLAEVVVKESLPTNVALSGALSEWTQQAGVSASQSSDSSGGVASRAIDGNTSGNWGDNSVTHTDSSTSNNWWEVDLGTDRAIELVTLHNRTDCCGERLSNYRVSVLNAARSELSGQNFYQASGNAASSDSWQLPSRVVGRYVRVQLLGLNRAGDNVLSLAEVQVYGNTNANAPIVRQSTTDYGGVALRATDGNTSGSYGDSSVTHTDSSTANNWWEVKLSTLHTLEQIVLYNRTDGSSNRLSNFRVSLWNGNTEVYGSDHFTQSGTSASTVFSLSSLNGMIGDKVRIALLGTNSAGDNVLSLAEVQLYGAPILNQAPVANDATFAVLENATVSTSVGTVTATDPDAGDSRSFAITAGNGAGKFAINSSSGVITTTATLDFETTQQYTLTVTVTDNGSPALNDTASITINVGNVSDEDSDNLDDSWEMSHYGSTGTVSGTADTDSDGYNTFKEMAFGTNPKAASKLSDHMTSNIIDDAGTAKLELKFRRPTNHAALGVVYQLKSSTNLSTWANDATPITATTPDADGITEWISYRFTPSAAAKKFIQLQATPAP